MTKTPERERSRGLLGFKNTTFSRRGRRSIRRKYFFFRSKTVISVPRRDLRGFVWKKRVSCNELSFSRTTLEHAPVCSACRAHAAPPFVCSGGCAVPRGLQRVPHHSAPRTKSGASLSASAAVPAPFAQSAFADAIGRAWRDAIASVSPAYNHGGRRVPAPRRCLPQLPRAVAPPIRCRVRRIFGQAPHTRSRGVLRSAVAHVSPRVPSASRVAAGDLDS